MLQENMQQKLRTIADFERNKLSRIALFLFVFLSVLSQILPLVDAPLQAANENEILGLHQPDNQGKTLLEVNSSPGPSLSPPPTSSSRVCPRRRLSSPEKIINLHEQLQKTLISSYQVLCNKAFGTFSMTSMQLEHTEITKTWLCSFLDSREQRKETGTQEKSVFVSFCRSWAELQTHWLSPGYHCFRPS